MWILGDSKMTGPYIIPLMSKTRVAIHLLKASTVDYFTLSLYNTLYFSQNLRQSEGWLLTTATDYFSEYFTQHSVIIYLAAFAMCQLGN